MIFVINNLKYDTTKMELISIKCEYKYTGTMLNMTLRYSGKNVKIFKRQTSMVADDSTSSKQL